MRSFFILLLIISLGANAQNAVPPIGSWREHLPYQSAIAITASERKIFVATPYSVYSVHTETNEIQRYSRLNGLAETGVSAIAFDSARQKLVIAYQNSNIDVISSNSISNVPGLKREAIQGDKSIHQVYPSNDYCYLATGLGIVVLDLNKNEIRDTWFIGAGGKAIPVFMITRDSRSFYAATAEGLKKAAETANLADYRNWIPVPLFPETKAVVTGHNQVYALQHDSVFVQTGNGWQPLHAGLNQVAWIMVSGGQVLMGQQTSGGMAVSFINPDGSVSASFRNQQFIPAPRAAVKINNNIWFADGMQGLSKWTGNEFIPYKLNAPLDAARGEMIFYGNRLLAAAGAVDASWNPVQNRNGFFTFSDNVWTNYNRVSYPVMDSMADFVTIVADPRDGSTWAGSFGGGLLHLGSSSTEVYKQASPLRPAQGSNSYQVSGLAFDAANNLWIANYGAPQNLHVRKANGSWQSFSIPFPIAQNAVSQVVIDDADQKWIVAPGGNGLICFNHGNSIENTSDDKWRWFQAGVAGGNLPSSHVLSIATDREGAIWVGTDDGIAMIPCPSEVFSGGCAAVLPVVKDGNFSNYLFKGEAVHGIAVDGADRKWIATTNGAWMISNTGNQVLAHFTEANSPLPSNDIKRIAINGTDGEIFFGTAKGIVSFRGGATEPAATQDQLLVYPNPVPPGYGGTIAVRGLAANSFVKITEMNGRLVFQAKALGGQVVWNGKDYTGKKIASGVYLVLATNESKTENKLGRIVFIGR